jgi:hypothetical protein
LAIRLEFINLVVLIQRIRDLYPGGWEAYLDDNVKRIGRVLWYDHALVRATDCMDFNDVDGLLLRFTSVGFTATESINGTTLWKDFLIVDAFGRSKFDCPWIAVEDAVAWLRGTEPGDVIGREHFR